MNSQVPPNNPPNMLRIVGIKMKRVLGLEEYSIEPGRSLTKWKGKNASTKTSILTGISATLKGGSLAKLAKVDSEEPPEVVLLLQGDGDEFFQITKVGKQTVAIKERVGSSMALKDRARPVEFLADLFDPRTGNPVSFLNAAPKEQLQMLLEALPVVLDEARVEEIYAGHEKLIPPIPQGLHPLEQLSKIREAIFAGRTGVNVSQKNAASTVQQLLLKIPANIPEDPEAAIAQLEALISVESTMRDAARQKAASTMDAELAAAEKEYACAISTLAVELNTAEQKALSESRAQVTLLEAERAHEEENLRAALELALRSLNSKYDEKKGWVRAEAQKLIDARKESIDGARQIAVIDRNDRQAAARAAHDQALQEIPAIEESIAKKREALAAARERGKSLVVIRTLQDQVQEHREKSELLMKESKELTLVLEELDRYKASLAEELPIKGLEILDGSIFLDRIPFETLNTAARIRLAVDICCLASEGRRLRAIFVDNLESLDVESQALLIQSLNEKGVQAFCAEVDHAAGPMEVERA